MNKANSIHNVFYIRWHSEKSNACKNEQKICLSFQLCLDVYSGAVSLSWMEGVGDTRKRDRRIRGRLEEHSLNCCMWRMWFQKWSYIIRVIYLMQSEHDTTQRCWWIHLRIHLQLTHSETCYLRDGNMLDGSIKTAVIWTKTVTRSDGERFSHHHPWGPGGTSSWDALMGKFLQEIKILPGHTPTHVTIKT